MEGNYILYHNYPKEVYESLQKLEAQMKIQKEAETRKFPFKKKGFRKHVR